MLSGPSRRKSFWCCLLLHRAGLVARVKLKPNQSLRTRLHAWLKTMLDPLDSKEGGARKASVGIMSHRLGWSHLLEMRLLDTIATCLSRVKSRRPERAYTGFHGIDVGHHALVWVEWMAE